MGNIKSPSKSICDWIKKEKIEEFIATCENTSVKTSVRRGGGANSGASLGGRVGDLASGLQGPDQQCAEAVPDMERP